MKTILETERLVLRELTPDDAAFIHALVNDPDWVRFIGPRDAATVEAAGAYMARTYLPLYARFGHGLWAVEPREGGGPVGMCGLLRRDMLPYPDIGYAFLPAGRGKGYAREAAAACLRHGHEVLGMRRIVAICTPDNAASRAVLEKIGMRFERLFVTGEPPEELCLYASGVDALPAEE